MNLTNVPNINDDSTEISCTYDEKSNSYQIHQVYRGRRSLGMGVSICGTSHESIASDIASVLTEMRKIGFEQGREHVRKALGV